MNTFTGSLGRRDDFYRSIFPRLLSFTFFKFFFLSNRKNKFCFTDRSQQLYMEVVFSLSFNRAFRKSVFVGNAQCTCLSLAHCAILFSKYGTLRHVDKQSRLNYTYNIKGNVNNVKSLKKKINTANDSLNFSKRMAAKLT